MKHPRLGQLIAEVKAREVEGWPFDRADASFELLVSVLRLLKALLGLPAWRSVTRIAALELLHLRPPLHVTHTAPSLPSTKLLTLPTTRKTLTLRR